MTHDPGTTSKVTPLALGSSEDKGSLPWLSVHLATVSPVTGGSGLDMVKT